ncbi:MAG: thioredoxin family protein [Erysipelotrichaceae bacterium]|nr:thioredoxin family protein [Erysipelotrichaceae bacterium]MBR3693283.1 thioredoxin family protein [Erysipelotrichales bacterium]
MFTYMKHLTSLEEVSAVLNSDGKHVFMFSAPWCGDCRYIEPFMESVMNRYPTLNFYYINRDDHIDLCQRWEIMGIPSFVGYEDHKEIGRFVSSLRKTEAQICDFLDSIK